MGGGRWGGHVRGSGESSEVFEHRRDRILEFPKTLCMHCGNTVGRGQVRHRELWEALAQHYPIN